MKHVLPSKSFFIEINDDRVIGGDKHIKSHIKLEVYKE